MCRVIGCFALSWSTFLGTTIKSLCHKSRTCEASSWVLIRQTTSDPISPPMLWRSQVQAVPSRRLLFRLEPLPRLNPRPHLSIRCWELWSEIDIREWLTQSREAPFPWLHGSRTPRPFEAEKTIRLPSSLCRGMSAKDLRIAVTPLAMLCASSQGEHPRANIDVLQQDG